MVMYVCGGVGGLVKVGGVDTEMYRTGHPSCLLHKPHHILLPQLLGPSLARTSTLIRFAVTNTGKIRKQRNVPAFSLGKVGFHRRVKTPLIYHELFGCYVPSLWTLRTVRIDCSCLFQQLTGRK